MKAKKKNKGTSVQNEYGFTLIEVLIAMAVTLIILAAAFGVFKTMSDSGSAAAKVAEIENDLQASINLMRLDLYKVGGDGIIPEEMAMLGNWQRNRCIRNNSIINDCNAPIDGDVVLLKGTRDNGTGYVLDGVTPGLVNDHSAMSVVYIDEFARGVNTVLKTADSLEVKAGDAKNVRKFSTIRQGDLVFLRKSYKIALMHVTGKTGNTLSFASDPTGMNQSLFTVLGANPNDEVEVELMRRVTYYLDISPAEGEPAWLMRQINFRPAVQLIPGVLGFQLTYELIDKTGGSGIQEINVAPGTRGSRQTGTKYSIDVDVQNDKQYFDDNPRRTTDIRRVNINIWADSMSAAIQGNDKHVLLDQTARVALRGYGDFIEPDPCVEEPFLEGCPCWEISEDMKAGYQTLDDLLAAGCPDLCAAAMKAEEATKESILALGCPDPCTKDPWFAGCPCAVTVQDILDGKKTVADLPKECGDICAGNPFFPTCPCTVDAFSKECSYCYNDPFAKGCPCATDPKNSKCPVNLDDEYGKCTYNNADCSEIRCAMGCASGSGGGAGKACTEWFGSYSGNKLKDPDFPLQFDGNFEKTSIFSQGRITLNMKDVPIIKTITDAYVAGEPKVFWLYYTTDPKQAPGISNATYSVPMIMGGSSCDENGKNCKCKSGDTAYYCYDERYFCRTDSNGNFMGLYRR